MIHPAQYFSVIANAAESFFMYHPPENGVASTAHSPLSFRKPYFWLITAWDERVAGKAQPRLDAPPQLNPIK